MMTIVMMIMIMTTIIQVTGLSPDTAYTVVMETSLGLGISHQVALAIDLHTDDNDGGGVDKIVVGWKVFKIIVFF